jgi:hypothetical protein
MWYRAYISKAKYDEIVNSYGERYGDMNTPPHCNSSTFHAPTTCAFCDGYYRVHPGFRPAQYATREANGWGGNVAPIVDDAKAAAEDAAWQRVFDEARVSGVLPE